MTGPLAPTANSIYEAAILACKASMAAANFRWYDKVTTCSSGTQRRYLKVTWDQGTPEQNQQNFDLARQIFWEHVSPYMYMTVVDLHSFAVAIREVMFEFTEDQI